MKVLCIIILNLCISQIFFGQKIPKNIQQQLDEIKNQAQLRLEEYRLSNKGTIYFKLNEQFSPSQLKRIDSLGLQLDIGLIYDKPMRTRIMQLLKDEYKQVELDTLVNRFLAFSIKGYKYKAIDIYRFDTIEIYHQITDSLQSGWEKQGIEPLFHNEFKYRAFFYMKLDTTQRFHNILNILVEKEKGKAIDFYINHKANTDLTFIAELAGYIGDKEFIQPLISALNNPNNFEKGRAMEALVRMRIEPYFSDFLKSHSLPLDQIKTGKKVDIDVLISVLPIQESFLEVSKYLLSNAPYMMETSESGTKVSQMLYEHAFELIAENIENKELKLLVGERDLWRDKKLSQQLYNWMQTNYGKYIIKRIW